MSWCTAEEVAELISVSRLRHDVSEAERKRADLRLIELYTSAVNVGDALVEVSVASNALSCSVRLAAALALESFVTERTWCEGIGFGDKERVLNAILASLRNFSLAEAAVTATEKQLNVLLCWCLCRVICFEYPTARWEAFIDECVSGIVSGQTSQPQAERAVVQETIILRLAETGSVKATLWWRLASVVVRHLLEWAATYRGERRPRLLCFRVALHLMRHRPRPSDATGAERPTTSFIFSDEFRGIVGRSLEEGVTAFETEGPHSSSLEEYGLLLDIAQHLLSDAAFAQIAFRCSISILLSCETAYLADVDDDSSLASCVDSALGCLIGVLQVYPEASLHCNSEKLLSTLFSYMTRAVTFERGEESTLLDALQEDYIVPLGCAGGDTAANASATLELLMEANPNLLGLAVGSLCATVTELQQGSDSPHWRAWTTALRCFCRVCDEKTLSLTDSLPDAADRLLSPLALLLRRTNNPLEVAELIELLALCIVRAEQESVCRAFFSILEDTFNGVGENGTREQSLLLAVTVYGVHRFFSSCASSIVPGTLCDASVWLRRALVVMSRGGPLAVYCGAYAVQTLLRIFPTCALPSTPLVLAALDNACRECNVPNASSLLAGLMCSLCLHSPGECNVAVERLEIVLSHCLHNGPRRTELRRSVTDYLWRFLKSFLQKKVCDQCVSTVLHKCLHVVLQFAVEDAPHDDATTRLLSNCLAAVVSCGHAEDMCENVSSVLWELLRSAVHEHHSSATLTKIVAAMSATALVRPTLLDGDMTAMSSLLFSNTDLSGVKGLNYMGCCLPPALFCIRHPEYLEDMATAFAATPLHKHLAWGTMFGLWSSVAPLSDHFTTLYFLAAWCRLLHYAIATRNEKGRDVLAVVMPQCTVYYLQSMHVKSPPKRRVTDCSMAQCIALGLALVEQRGRKSAKVKLLEEEMLQLLSLNRRFEALACCSATEAGVSALFSMSPTEGSQWLLEVMSSSGYGPQVESAMRFARES